MSAMMNSVTKNIFSFSTICLVLLCAAIAMAAPSGYCVLPDKDVTPEIGKIAHSMLGNSMGSCTPFSIVSTNYQGCVEWHWDKTRGTHKGVTVYHECKPK
jgi:hypothetical protein